MKAGNGGGTTRRGVLGMAAALGAGALTTAVSGRRKAEAADGGALVIGEGNSASSLTSLGGGIAGPVMEVFNTDSSGSAAAIMGLVSTPFPTEATASAVYGRTGRVNGIGVQGHRY